MSLIQRCIACIRNQGAYIKQSALVNLLFICCITILLVINVLFVNYFVRKLNKKMYDSFLFQMWCWILVISLHLIINHLYNLSHRADVFDNRLIQGRWRWKNALGWEIDICSFTIFPSLANYCFIKKLECL